LLRDEKEKELENIQNQLDKLRNFAEISGSHCTVFSPLFQNFFKLLTIYNNKQEYTIFLSKNLTTNLNLHLNCNLNQFRTFHGELF
jgi:hypothetical protein